MTLIEIRALLKAREFDRALVAVNSCLEACPDNFHLWNLRGDLIQLQDSKEGLPLAEAEQSYLKSLECRPDNWESLEALAHLYDVVLPDSTKANDYARRFLAEVRPSIEQMEKIVESETSQSL